MTLQERETRRLQQLRRDLERDGYEVVVHPRDVQLPDELAGFQVDLLATRGDETIIVEVKTSSMIAGDRQLASLSSAIERLAGYEFRLEVLGPDPDRPDPADPTTLTDRLSSAADLASAGQLEAALLLAWAAFEGALRRQDEDDHPSIEHRRPPTVSALIRELISDGSVPPHWLPEVDQLRDLRSRVAHGFEAEVTARDLERLISLAGYLLEDDDAKVEELVEWFLANYEDPANGVPYDGREGGYQYYLGGPYDPQDVLADEFPDTPPHILEAAVQELMSHGGDEWVKNGQY